MSKYTNHRQWLTLGAQWEDDGAVMQVSEVPMRIYHGRDRHIIITADALDLPTLQGPKAITLIGLNHEQIDFQPSANSTVDLSDEFVVLDTYTGVIDRKRFTLFIVQGEE